MSITAGSENTQSQILFEDWMNEFTDENATNSNYRPAVPKSCRITCINSFA